MPSYIRRRKNGLVYSGNCRIGQKNQQYFDKKLSKLAIEITEKSSILNLVLYIFYI